MRLFLVLLVLMISCVPADKIQHDCQLESEGLKTICKLTKIKIQSLTEEEREIFNIKTDKRTIIYGEIEITNMKNQDTIVNLGNYFLIVNGRLSSKLYIDSSADFMLQDQLLKAGESIRQSVYWFFDGLLNMKDYKKIQLSFK